MKSFNSKSGTFIGIIEIPREDLIVIRIFRNVNMAIEIVKVHQKVVVEQILQRRLLMNLHVIEIEYFNLFGLFPRSDPLFEILDC